jgi:regulator of sigma E protease
MTGNVLIDLLEFVVVFGLLLFTHEFGHYIMARVFNIEVEEFGFGFPPKVKTLFYYKGTEFTLNAIPFGAFVRPKGENDPEVPGGMASANPWKRLGVLFGGPFMNMLVGFILFIVLFVRVGSPDTSVILIDQVADASPAAQAGLLAGDQVIKVNDQSVASIAAMQTIVTANKGTEISVVVKRAAEEVTLHLTPRVNPPEGQGAMGIAMSNPSKPIPVMQAIPIAAAATVDLCWQTITLPVKLIEGAIPKEQARMVGPVGMFSIFRQVSAMDQEAQSTAVPHPATTVLYFICTISVALGITNLLPIPALDGGRILFLLPELLFRKRVPAKYENFVHMIGFTALLLLMAVITIQDVFNPIQLK